jgi:hypothetical protein
MAVLTLGLQSLRRQVDEAFPGRHRTSDGWIGDAAHQDSTSGHNPDDTAGSRPSWNGDPDKRPEVRAWDMDADLGWGVTTQDVVDHIRRLPGLRTALRYIIYNRRIYHIRSGFAPAPYEGDDPHTNHVHYEGAWTQAADNNTSFDYRLQEVPVALTAGDKQWLTSEITRIVESRMGDVVERYQPNGSRVPPSDPNPTMTVANAAGYAVRSADLARYTLDEVVIPALERIERKLPDSGPAE